MPSWYHKYGFVVSKLLFHSRHRPFSRLAMGIAKRQNLLPFFDHVVTKCGPNHGNDCCRVPRDRRSRNVMVFAALPYSKTDNGAKDVPSVVTKRRRQWRSEAARKTCRIKSKIRDVGGAKADNSASFHCQTTIKSWQSKMQWTSISCTCKRQRMHPVLLSIAGSFISW